MDTGRILPSSMSPSHVRAGAGPTSTCLRAVRPPFAGITEVPYPHTNEKEHVERRPRDPQPGRLRRRPPAREGMERSVYLLTDGTVGKVPHTSAPGDAQEDVFGVALATHTFPFAVPSPLGAADLSDGRTMKVERLLPGRLLDEFYDPATGELDGHVVTAVGDVLAGLRDLQFEVPARAILDGEMYEAKADTWADALVDLGRRRVAQFGDQLRPATLMCVAPWRTCSRSSHRAATSHRASSMATSAAPTCSSTTTAGSPQSSTEATSAFSPNPNLTPPSPPPYSTCTAPGQLLSTSRSLKPSSSASAWNATSSSPTRVSTPS